ncbi:MAG: polysaccharide deacetylase family protein [Candidatus Nanopelagicales bacterium]|nr:polysaccharide deacetylase family protein [Candidatus Nanopelagicales bacterium]MDZ4248618.1 polysaccharide deacetylase family protein [Candidatus Nanopelagicales bacterium]
MRTSSVLAFALAGVTLAGCASVAGPSGSPSPSTPATTAPAPTPTPTPAETVKPTATAITNGSRRSNQVAITLDADMTPYALQRVRSGEYGPQVNYAVIRFLERREVPATIFITGMWAKQYPEVLARLAANPLIELGNHTWNHDAWTSSCYDLPFVAGDRQKRSEVRRTSAILRAATGRQPTFFRFPGLCHDQRDVEIVAEESLWTVDFDLTASDAFAQDAGRAASAIESEIRPGSIVILHLNGAPNAPATAPILRQLVRTLDDRQLEPVTLSTLLRPQG